MWAHGVSGAEITKQWEKLFEKTTTDRNLNKKKISYSTTGIYLIKAHDETKIYLTD